MTKLLHSERKNRSLCCSMHACALITEMTVFVLFNNNTFLPSTPEVPQEERCNDGGARVCVVMQMIQAFFGVYSRKGRL